MNGGWRSSFVRGIAIGGLAAAVIGLLLGAVHNDGPVLSVPVPDHGEDRVVPALASSGRYQIAAWEGGGAYGAFVLDTATGAVKVAYSSGKGPGGKGVNNLGKPFAQMQ